MMKVRNKQDKGYMNGICHIVKITRESKGLLQKDVAQDLKCSLKHYCNFENGNVENMGFIIKVLDYFGCKIQILTPKITLKKTLN